MSHVEEPVRPLALLLALVSLIVGVACLLQSALFYRNVLVDPSYACLDEAPGYGSLTSEVTLFPLGLRCDWFIEGTPVTVMIPNWTFTISLIVLVGLTAATSWCGVPAGGSQYRAPRDRRTRAEHFFSAQPPRLSLLYSALSRGRSTDSRWSRFSFFLGSSRSSSARQR